MSLKTTKDKVLNHIYDLLSRDRTCSNCKHVKEEPREFDKIMVLATHGRHEIKMIKKCSLDNSFIRENEVNTKNCRYFKRKYGSTPAIRKIHSSISWTEKQWKLHKDLIFFIVAILTLIASLIVILISKGFL